MSYDFNHPNSYGQEGEDHINISGRSNTRLGKLLDPSYYKTLEYHPIGKFGSVMNLWYWLRTDPSHDWLRRASGEKLRQFLVENRCNAYVPNFRAIIAQATYDKLKNYPDSLQELKSLPKEVKFISYYVPRNTSLRVCSNYASVIVPIVEMIQQALQDGQEPDFSKLLPPNTDISHNYLGPFLTKRFPKLYPTAEQETT